MGPDLTCGCYDDDGEQETNTYRLYSKLNELVEAEKDSNAAKDQIRCARIFLIIFRTPFPFWGGWISNLIFTGSIWRIASWSTKRLKGCDTLLRAAFGQKTTFSFPESFPLLLHIRVMQHSFFMSLSTWEWSWGSFPSLASPCPWFPTAERQWSPFYLARVWSFL